MANPKRQALGKGIGALLSSAAQEGGKKYFTCPVEELRPHSRQPRKSFDDAKMQELVASIEEKGIIQPLVVRQQADHYQIIAGERRWRAAQKAGLDYVPVVIQDVSEDWALEIALIENLQREDLNPLEEADAYRHLMESFDLRQEEVAKRVGKERSTIANALRLLRLPEGIKKDLGAGLLSMGHARALLSLDNDEDMAEAGREIRRKKLSVRETEKLVKRIKSFGQSGASGPSSPAVAADPETRELEKRLREYLGTQVKLVKRGRGGKIEINFHDPVDLSRITEQIGLG